MARERGPVLHTTPVPVARHAGQVEQDREPRRALHQGADGRAAQSHDEIPLPVARHCPIICLGRALADQDLGGDADLAPSAAARPRHPQRPPGAQAGGQLAAQRPAALHVQRLVDGLVTDAHGLIVREVEPQPPGDLLRAPRPGPSRARPARTAALPGPQTSSASLSCTYPRSAAFTASFVGFGRRVARSACHCAVVARYARPPLRVAALRRSSREIVDAARPSRRAVSRTPQPRARNSASSSRSANDRYRSDGGFADGANILGDMPPASRNQRAPTAGDTPTSIAAASLDRPTAIAAQNRRRFSRCATPGRPGDRGTTARSARSERRFPALIATPSVKVLRRPLEPKQDLIVSAPTKVAAVGG